MKPLTQYGRLAERHWREFLPKMVAELEATGQLYAMLIEAEEQTVSRLHCKHQETQFKLRSRVRHLSDKLPRLEKRLEAVSRDLITRQDTSGEKFVLVLEGQEIRDRGIAGDLLLRRAERMRGSRAERPVGSIAGFELLVAENLPRTITDSRKRLADTQAQVNTPFEYAKRLTELVQRQQEIEDELDLTKNQAPSQLAAEEANPQSTPEAEIKGDAVSPV